MHPIPSPVEIRRVRRFLTAHLVGLLAAVVALPVLGLTVARSVTIWVDAALLAMNAVVVAVALVCLGRGRHAVAVVLVLAGTWAMAIGTTAVTPFLLPINLLALIVPLMVMVVLLPARMIRPLSLAAVLAATAVAGLGEFARAFADQQPEPWLTIPIVVVFVPAVAGVVAFGVAQSYSRVVEQAELLRGSRARVVAAADDARRRLERDLHDGAQQRLVTTSVRLTLARRVLATDPGRADQALAEAVAELHEALRDLRELAHGIYPPLLAERGLAPALAAATRRLPVPVDLRVPGDVRYPADVEAAVYFCCLEAMQNAVKHAGPSRIGLTVEAGATLTLAVVDDGHGYDGVTVRPGNGMANMADRVAAVGGWLVVDTLPGRGTTIRAEIPLPAPSSP